MFCLMAPVSSAVLPMCFVVTSDGLLFMEGYFYFGISVHLLIAGRSLCDGGSIK